MTLPNSQKPKDYALKVSENEEKDIEMPYDITYDELTHKAKRIKMIFQKAGTAQAVNPTMIVLPSVETYFE